MEGKTNSSDGVSLSFLLLFSALASFVYGVFWSLKPAHYEVEIGDHVCVIWASVPVSVALCLPFQRWLGSFYIDGPLKVYAIALALPLASLFCVFSFPPCDGGYQRDSRTAKQRP